MPLTIAVTDARGRPVRVAGLAAWLRRVAPRRARGSLTIALITDAEMRKLNRDFRGVDDATDVLSFSGVQPPAPWRPGTRHPTRHPNLGDLAIAKGIARRQARQHGHTESVELRLLALHGLLHLLGYDHERDDGEMRRVEQRLRRKGGLREGLIERA